MKSKVQNVQKVVAALAVVLIATTLISAKKPKQKSEMLDWKGAAMGGEIPEWIKKSHENDIAIQSLADFKDQYCFVVTVENGNKDFAINWVKNLSNGGSEVSRMLSVTVNQTAESAVSGKKSQGVDMHFSDVSDAMSNASFQGLRQVADFWALTRNKKAKQQYYTAWSLWIVPSKSLNDQIAANIQNIIDNNVAMSEAERQIYLDIIKDVRTRGIATNVALAD